MKTINSEKSVSRYISSRFLMLLVFLACLFLNNLARAEVCLLKKQLNDPSIRAEYEAVIAENRTNNSNLDVEEMYGNIRPASYSEIPVFVDHDITSRIDSISMECIACHDGVLAREARHRIFNGNTQSVKSIETITGAHPIGMDYDQYRWDKEYVSADRLPADMVLMNGTVTCVSCHNMLGKNKKYLVVDNDNSRLCFSCHIK